MKIIKSDELKKRLANKEVLLIDIREPAEHRSQRIRGSHSISLNEISIEKLPSKPRPIVIYCQSGKRSCDAYKKLLDQDQTLDIYSLDGGILAWDQLGFAIEKSGSNILPLDRQTQLVVGFITFLGTVLGNSVHDLFYTLSAFIGLGLMFAGITGWCGMAKVLARMPWNR